MPSKADVRKIDGDKISTKRRFDKRDFDFIAEFVVAEFERRKTDRLMLEKHWSEIDRQIAMEPDRTFKTLPNGKIDTNKLWMAEMELPLQAQAREVLTTDSRRMMFPDNGPWFKAHAETTDEYLENVDFQSIIKGDEAEVPTQINQDNADKLVQGFLMSFFSEYDLPGRVDRINSEAFSYGMGLARVRKQTKNLYIHEARGVRKENQMMPVIQPVSIKNHYLDTPMPSMHTSQVLGDSVISKDWMRLENLKLAANVGSSDPENEDGGWMPSNFSGVDDKDGFVEVLEMEGDIVVPRKTTASVVLPGAIITVVVGAKNKDDTIPKKVIRLRFRKMPFSSYLQFPYQFETVDGAYPTGPLMKGRPLQIMAVDSINRLMDSAALKNAPPTGYDRADVAFAADGGPVIHPGALWGTTDEVRVYSEIGGDPAALSGIFSSGVNMYAELTGVLPARLGAQTVSHTTAFAKDAEIQRGAVRTVGYVSRSGHSPMTRALYMVYTMGRAMMTPSQTSSFFIEEYGGFVEIGKEMLPKNVMFKWFGAGGPAEASQRMQSKSQSAQLAIQVDQVSIQAGNEATVDIPAMVRQLLRDGGWTDLDTITRSETAVDRNAAAPGIPGTDSANAGPATAAIQTIGQA